jgi:hypothetical protein
MEFAVYSLITMLVAAAMYWCSVQSGRRPGTPLSGWFRYREAPTAPPAEGKVIAPLASPPGAWRRPR